MPKDQQKFDEAMDVASSPDEVEIRGPDGIRGSLTPRAALQSAHRLEDAAQRAARNTPRAWRLRKAGE